MKKTSMKIAALAVLTAASSVVLGYVTSSAAWKFTIELSTDIRPEAEIGFLALCVGIFGITRMIQIILAASARKPLAAA